MERRVDIAMLKAVERRDLEWFKRSLKKGADVNAETLGGQTVLHIAARNGDLPIFSHAVEKGAEMKVNKRGHSPLHVAVESGYFEVARHAIEKGAQVNEKILELAKDKGSVLIIEMVEKAYREQANANARRLYGERHFHEG